jgi:hypothetical protein
MLLDSGPRSRVDTGCMSSCCCPERGVQANGLRCPQSGSVGSPVGRHTIKAVLTEHGLRRLMSGEYRFCPDAGCDVVYFDAGGRRFRAEDVRVPVWQKLPFGTRPICYCFGESEASIRSEFEAHGRSLAVERVREHIAAGRCACELRNPRGMCCLGDLRVATERVERIVGSSSRGGGIAGQPDVG